jgi:hypothetical protein
VLGLNKEDLGRQHSPLYKENVGLRLGRDMPLTVRKLQGAPAAKVCVTREPNCGVLWGN